MNPNSLVLVIRINWLILRTHQSVPNTNLYRYLGRLHEPFSIWKFTTVSKLWKWPVINSTNWNFDNFSLSDSKTWRHPSSSPLYLRELGCVGGKMPSFKNERARSGRQLEITFRLFRENAKVRKNFQVENLGRDSQTFSLWTEPGWVNIETLGKPRVWQIDCRQSVELGDKLYSSWFWTSTDKCFY